MTAEPEALAAGILGQLSTLRELAEAGNETAAATVQWFEQATDTAFTMGALEDDHQAIKDLAAKAGNTAHLMFLARASRYLVDKGKFPTHYTLTISVEWGDIDDLPQES